MTIMMKLTLSTLIFMPFTAFCSQANLHHSQRNQRVYMDANSASEFLHEFGTNVRAGTKEYLSDINNKSMMQLLGDKFKNGGADFIANLPILVAETFIQYKLNSYLNQDEKELTKESVEHTLIAKEGQELDKQLTRLLALKSLAKTEEEKKGYDIEMQRWAAMVKQHGAKMQALQISKLPKPIDNSPRTKLNISLKDLEALKIAQEKKEISLNKSEEKKNENTAQEKNSAVATSTNA